MSIDLLPISAFALESCTAADSDAGASQTLTLPLALAPVLQGREVMFGTATSAVLTAHPHAAVLRASVVAAGGGGITITF